MNAWADAIRSADGVIIVSPEYNWTIPGALKNAIDWVSRMKDQPFKDKPVAIQSCAGGVLGGARMQYHLRQSLTSVDAIMFGRPEILVTFAATKFDEKTLRAEGPADHRHRQAAARGVREVHPAGRRTSGLQRARREPRGAARRRAPRARAGQAGHVGLHRVAVLGLQIGEVAVAFGKPRKQVGIELRQLAPGSTGSMRSFS